MINNKTKAPQTNSQFSILLQFIIVFSKFLFIARWPDDCYLDLQKM